MATHDQQIRTSGTAFVVTRTFDAPRELVFAAYASCEHLKNWWGPRTWPMAECTMDFRVGGRWHYCLRGPNEGDESWGLAIYEEIVIAELIAYRDTFADARGNVNEAMPQVRARVEFAEVDGKTRLTMRASYPTAEDLRTVLDMGMEAGLTETLDRLDEHLAAAAPNRS